MKPASLRAYIASESRYPLISYLSYHRSLRKRAHADALVATIGHRCSDGSLAHFSIALSKLELDHADEPTQRLMLKTRIHAACEAMDRFLAGQAS